MKALIKGEFEGNIISKDIGSKARMTQTSLALLVHVANRTLPHWFLPNLSACELRSCSRPGATCILPAGRQNDHQNDLQALHPLGCAPPCLSLQLFARLFMNLQGAFIFRILGKEN